MVRKEEVMSLVNEKIERALQFTDDIPEDRVSVYKTLVLQERMGLEKVAEMTTTENIDRVVNVFLPAIRKLVKDSIIQNIVGVQPIPDRISSVEYMDVVYASGPNAGKSAIEPSNNSIDYSRDPGEGQKITNELDVVFKEKEVKALSRKIAARWTFEAADSFSKKGYNLEAEITKSVAYFITREISFEILKDLLDGATGATATWQAPAASDSPAVQERKEKELFFNILDVAAEIENKTGRYPNWIVVSPKVASILRRTGNFIVMNDRKSVKSLYYLGVFNDEFEMYVVPGFANDKVLVGYKGNSELEAGYIYAPYIPLLIQDSFFNVENWTWIKSIGSFYAKALTLSDLYGVINIQY